VKSKYTSGKSVGKNQTVPIGVDDPRLKPGKIGQTKARQGAEIDIVGLDGKSLIGGGRTLNNPAGRVPPAPPAFPSEIVIPVGGNKPPKTYPGGSGPVIIVPTNPSNVSVVWAGNDLVISFDWDYTNTVNDTVSQFVVELTSGGVTKRSQSNIFIPNRTQTGQTITVTKSIITSMFNVFRTSFSSVCVLTADPLNNVSSSICAPSVPEYVLDLPTPVINVTSITSGYSVAYTTPTQDVFDGIEVVEYESNASTEPTGVTYKRTFFSTLNPAVVLTPNFNKRWVKARFSSDGGIYTPYSAAQVVTPTVIGSVDLTPPSEVDSASAAWSGDNIIVSYELPSSDAGIRVEIALTSSNSLVGYFYRFPAGSGTSQTATITKRDLLEQFGQHYSSFTGLLKSIDSNDNRTDGVSFNVPQRSNPLTGVVPTFSITPLTNGYSIFANNYESTPGVTFMEVYAKHTPWITDPTNDDDVVYAGPNPAVIIDTEYTPVYIKVRYYDDFDNGSSYSNQSNNSTTPLDAGIVTSFENPITFGANGVIYAGENYNSGKRTLFKTGGIFAYDSDGVKTTEILSDADAGTPTFITKRAQIADWNITDTKIENDLSGPPTSYTGLSATGDYSFWAGSDTTGGDDSANFYVTSAGQVQSKNINIIGSGSKAVTATISGTTATYTSTVDHKFMVGQTVKISNMTPAGYNVTRDIVSVPTTKTFTVANVTATGSGSGGIASTSLLSAGGVFNVFNDGSMSASSADILGKITASSGSFTGNILIESGGSLYSPKTAGTVPAPGVAGVIFKNDAISAFGNTSGSYTQMYSTPLADGSTFKTTAADIGGWKVNDSSISRTGAANISLNATAGNISVSSQNVSSYTSGINGPVVSTGSTPVDDINGTPVGAENVFWAGSGGATGTSNAFRVTLSGNLYASNAKITGTVSSVGALGTMTMDGEYGYMSLKTAGSSAPTSYLVPRNNNIYLTSPSLTEPWSTGKQISSSGPTNGPYLAVGSEFKDYWNNTAVKGVGLYTGAWDYFTTGASSPFITASTTGIQLSVSPALGLLLDGGTAATGDKLTPAIPQGTPSMLFYTARRTTLGPNNQPVYSPDTEYGAWASFTNRVIKLTADEFLFINVEGSDTPASRRIIMKATDAISYQMNSEGIKIQIDANTHQTFANDSIKIQATSTVYQTLNSAGIKINATTDVWQRYDSDGIRLQSTDAVYQEFDSTSIVLTSGNTSNTASERSAYTGGSKITINGTKVSITGIPKAPAFDMADYRIGTEGDGSYRNTPPLGYPPRQRMVIEDPVSGEAQLGMAVYYLDLTKVNVTLTSGPSDTMGVQGDLAVMF
jgi:hypothetical protein